MSRAGGGETDRKEGEARKLSAPLFAKSAFEGRRQRRRGERKTEDDWGNIERRTCHRSNHRNPRRKEEKKKLEKVARLNQSEFTDVRAELLVEVAKKNLADFRSRSQNRTGIPVKVARFHPSVNLRRERVISEERRAIG